MHADVRGPRLLISSWSNVKMWAWELTRVRWEVICFIHITTTIITVILIVIIIIIHWFKSLVNILCILCKKKKSEQLKELVHITNWWQLNETLLSSVLYPLWPSRRDPRSLQFFIMSQNIPCQWTGLTMVFQVPIFCVRVSLMPLSLPNDWQTINIIRRTIITAAKAIQKQQLSSHMKNYLKKRSIPRPLRYFNSTSTPCLSSVLPRGSSGYMAPVYQPFPFSSPQSWRCTSKASSWQRVTSDSNQDRTYK